MTMLTDHIDAVVGVDTHADTHTAVVLDRRGVVLATVKVSTDLSGYAELLDTVIEHAPGRQVVWAVEGTGSYGAGLTRALHEWDQQVVEVRAVKRERGRGKSDAADAVTIARTALATDRPGQPRRGVVRAALGVLTSTRSAEVRARTRLTNQLKALVMRSPDQLRSRFRQLTTTAQVTAATRLRTPAGADAEVREFARCIRQIAKQIRALDRTITALESELDHLTSQHAAALRAEFGVGPVSAAQILITYSHPGRFHSAEAFSAIAGASPIEASSGKIIRHRLNRSGDRQLNAALHRVMATRRAHKHPETIAYIQRRTAEGRTSREIERCLKKALSRRLYRILETMPAMP